MPGVARDIYKNLNKKIEFLNKKKFDFLAYVTHEFPQKNSAHLVQPFGKLKLTYMYDRRALLYIY